MWDVILQMPSLFIGLVYLKAKTVDLEARKTPVDLIFLYRCCRNQITVHTVFSLKYVLKKNGCARNSLKFDDLLLNVRTYRWRFKRCH
jgi:hypothetical protein